MGARSLKNLKILITCGPTWMPIDPIRVISNRSTGSMGHLIAANCRKAGANVTVLEGPVQHPLTDKNIAVKNFTTFDELYKLLRDESKKNFDIIIHAAAVADYRVKVPKPTKIASEKNALTLNLVPTKKIIPMIKKWNKHCLLVGFKQETKVNKTNAPALTQKLFVDSKCDLVVANMVRGKEYKGFILNPQGKFLAEAQSRNEIANALVNSLNKY